MIIKIICSNRQIETIDDRTKKSRRDKHRDDIARKDGILVLDKVLS